MAKIFITEPDPRYPGGKAGAFGEDESTRHSTSQTLRLFAKAVDIDGNEFIYLKGVASTAVGDLVTYDELGVTTRSVPSAVGPCAIAMSACVASEFGWYQVRGLAAGTAAAAVADNGKIFLHATAGAVDDASVAGDQVCGAIARSATGGAGAITLQINYPQVGINVA